MFDAEFSVVEAGELRFPTLIGKYMDWMSSVSVATLVTGSGRQNPLVQSALRAAHAHTRVVIHVHPDQWFSSKAPSLRVS